MKTQDIRNMGLALQQVQEADDGHHHDSMDYFADKPGKPSHDEIKKHMHKHGGDSLKIKSVRHSKNNGTSVHFKGHVKHVMKLANYTHDEKYPHNDKGYKTYAKDMGMKTEAVGTATHKPNNGQDPEQGLSPNAKKEKARTSGVGVDANKAIDMSFKTFRAMTKTARHNGGVNPPGDKAIIKSTMAPAANQKTESVDVVAEVKQGKPIKGKIGDPIKAAYHGEEKKKAKKNDKLDDGDGMDPVGKADADIDNDGDVDKTDNYLNNRRDAIRAKMKGKGKKEDAVMHGGKTGAKSEKKEKEIMAVGEGAMKRMSSGDGMDTYKKKPKDEDANAARQMKDPKKDAMVAKGGKVKVIDKNKEKDHLKRGYVRAEMNDVPKTMKRPAMPQKGLMPPAAKKGSPY